jgi:hypothetical protein
VRRNWEGVSLEVHNIKKSFISYLYDIRFIILFYVIGDWTSTLYAMPVGTEYNSIPAICLENYGIYYLLIVKMGLVLLLFYITSTLQVSKFRWDITKHIIESIGILVTVNNLLVIFNETSLIQAVGLV